MKPTSVYELTRARTREMRQAPIAGAAYRECLRFRREDMEAMAGTAFKGKQHERTQIRHGHD